MCMTRKAFLSGYYSAAAALLNGGADLLVLVSYQGSMRYQEGRGGPGDRLATECIRYDFNQSIFYGKLLGVFLMLFCSMLLIQAVKKNRRFLMLPWVISAIAVSMLCGLCLRDAIRQFVRLDSRTCDEGYLYHETGYLKRPNTEIGALLGQQMVSLNIYRTLVYILLVAINTFFCWHILSHFKHLHYLSQFPQHEPSIVLDGSMEDVCITSLPPDGNDHLARPMLTIFSSSPPPYETVVAQDSQDHLPVLHPFVEPHTPPPTYNEAMAEHRSSTLSSR